MTQYIELTILHDNFVASSKILEAVYSKLHTKFSSLRTDDNTQPVGVSFPRYDISRGLGDKIRLFASDDILISLNLATALEELEKYVHISDVLPVPAKVSHGHYRRVQVQSNMIRVARRKAKREGITLEEATERLSQFEETHTSLPFVYMGSKSTSQSFKLFVYCERVKDKAVGAFSTYGLSASSTVPIF